MKTEKEIREKLQELEKDYKEAEKKGETVKFTYVYTYLKGQIEALKWVLNDSSSN